MYSPRVTECIEAAKLTLPKLDQVELFKQYFEIANPYVNKKMFLPGEKIKYENICSHRRNIFNNGVNLESYRIHFFLPQGDLTISLSIENIVVDFIAQPKLSGIFIKNNLLGNIDGIFLSRANFEYSYLQDLKTFSEYYTPFQTFLENMIFKPIKVELPEKLVCLPQLHWSESNFAYEFIDNYYCLESEVTNSSVRCIIETA